MAQPGTKIIAHQKPATRGSWETRGVDGWYIGGAMDHYQCHEIYINRTQQTLGDKIEYFLYGYKIPFRSSAENATKVANERISVLKNPAPVVPYSKIGDAQMEAII